MTTDMDYSSIWNQALNLLREDIGATSFDIWFSMVTFNTFQNDTFYIYVPNTLAKEWIESRYIELIEKKLHELIKRIIYVVLTTEVISEQETPLFLNSKYTFDTFVVGNSNKFAHAACYAVGEAPFKAYNPLFIYGGVGLGKTHLMQAIGNNILSKWPSFSVRYVSSEQFTNELISSIKDDNTSGFRNKYRNIDVLLIDDIQFLAGKERTQEEFFHTFNTLYEANKQLVISSDRPPKSIPTLEDRLISRFEWGLITDIGPPDLETRIAILRKKAQFDNFYVPYDILDYIAGSVDSNIRELEGALIRLLAYSKITGKDISMNTLDEALKEILNSAKSKKITIEVIQQLVASQYGITVTELISKKRNKQLVYPRQIAMYLCRKYTDASFPQIGQEFGGRDHSTVIYATEKTEKSLLVDSELSSDIDNLSKKIQNNNK